MPPLIIVQALIEEIQLASENLEAIVNVYLGEYLIQGNALEHSQVQDLSHFIEACR